MSIKSVLVGGVGDGNVGLLLMRVFTGGALLTHGWPKLFGGKLSGFIQYVASLGIPAPSVLGFLAILAETVGAICLLVGFLTRPMAAMIAATMALAAFVAHRGAGFQTRELALLYLVAALLFLFKGGGKWSVDRLFA
ncbi:MAG: DoxX family protein [Kiritimatiellia bacterium]